MMALSPPYGYRYAVPKRRDPSTAPGENFGHETPKRRAASLAALRGVPSPNGYNRHAMPNGPLIGSLRILFLYDVCEEIRTGQLRTLLASGRQGLVSERRRDPAFLHPAPGYVRFERPPMMQQLGSVTLKNGAQFDGELNYYEYGVVSVKLGLPFAVDWPELVRLSSQWIAGPAIEQGALQIARRCLASAQPALIRPIEEWLVEDYYVIHLHNQVLPDGSQLFKGAELLAEHGKDIARIVRGELAELSDEERREILGSRMSYYPDDLLVVGWNAAFLCDTTEGATPTVQLLEYANTQLLEFRYYDAVLSRVLGRVYSSLDKRGGIFQRWRLAREAQSLNKIRLDVRELTERMDTSIKFLSDMFSARQYRMAAGKIGVDDYRRLVESKLHTAGDLYSFMMDQFHASRGFVLEVMVVIILVIELVFVFRGK